MKIVKQLFICSTELQLFNALNLKIHLFPNDSSDIIIQFLKRDTVDFYHRVKEAGLFENVAYRIPEPFGLHAYVRQIRAGDFSGSVMEAAGNSAKRLYTLMSSQKNRSFLDNIKSCVCGLEDLDFSAYQEVFVGGTNDIVFNICKYIQHINPSCILTLYEEGIGDYPENYSEDIMKIRFDNFYLYEPNLALHMHPSFKTIPKVQKGDFEFINAVNHIFSYASDKKEIRNKIVFFDNYAEPMPAYLQYSTILSRSLFRVSYKKHLFDHQIFTHQLRAYNLLADYAKEREVIVKLHPRTERADIQKEYRREKTRVMENISVPWEVFCCNCEMENNVFVTLCSSAATARNFIMEDDNNLVIILEEYASVGSRSFDLFCNFYRKLQKEEMQGRLYLPKNEDEYINILREILGAKDSMNI